jgi:uncharacterized membrane protein YkgB
METLATPAQDLDSSAGLTKKAKSNLTKIAAWTIEHNIPLLITSIGMIAMLLWAGSYKMTAPGAQGVIPLVSNSLLISCTLSYSALTLAPI